MSKRRIHSPEFETRVAMEAISGSNALQEIAADGAERLIQASQWKNQLPEDAARGRSCRAFTRCLKSSIRCLRLQGLPSA